MIAKRSTQGCLKNVFGLYLEVLINQRTGQLFGEGIDDKYTGVVKFEHNFLTPIENLRRCSASIQNLIIIGRIVCEIKDSMIAQKGQEWQVFSAQIC